MGGGGVHLINPDLIQDCFLMKQLISTLHRLDDVPVQGLFLWYLSKIWYQKSLGTARSRSEFWVSSQTDAHMVLQFKIEDGGLELTFHK